MLFKVRNSVQLSHKDSSGDTKMYHCSHTCCSYLSPSALPRSFLPVLLFRLWMEFSVSCLSIFFFLFDGRCKQEAKYACFVEICGLFSLMIYGVCPAGPHHRSENGHHRWWFHVCWKSGMALFHVVIQSNHSGKKINLCNFIEDFGWPWIPAHENNVWF